MSLDDSGIGIIDFSIKNEKMKRKIILAATLFFFSTSLWAQMSEKGAVVEKTLTRTSSKVTLNDISTFKSQFDEWNTGNLHIYSAKGNANLKNYYFQGEKISPMFQQYLPKELKKKVVEEGSEPHHVALVRGQGLDDYYIVRINDGKSDNTIVLYEIKNQQLEPKKTLAYYYEKGGRKFQMDSWMQDVNGDTRLDLIQKKEIKDRNGNVVKEKTKVFLKKKNGKFKRSRKTKVKKSDYIMQTIN